MSKSYRRGSGKAVLASLTGLVLASSMWAPASAVEAPDGAPTAEGLQVQPSADLKIAPRFRDTAGQVAAYIQFSGEGAFEQTQPLSVVAGDSEPIPTADQVLGIRADIQSQADEVAAEASASQLYTTTNTIPGVAIQGDAEAIRALAARPDVVKITGIVPKTPGNKGADIDTRSLNAWTERDETGEGVTIAVLDTGLDYTHAGFGGDGEIATFEAASAPEANLPTTPPNEDWYDPAKYKGGWDLVGDNYNAASTEAADLIPQPDANPMDCQSHGSHVAGTSSGYGVNADGTTFDGAYNQLTAEQVNEMKIGPGSAPESGIVALRVFGCEGSSLVVGQALDLVLDPNQDGVFDDASQVVNMSLGSSFPAYDDPENDIVNALTGLGVLSVVSAGNDGDIYDIGGSPGSAKSALTVAASVGSQITLDAVEVLAPEDVAGTAAGQYSVNFDYASADPAVLTGTVVKPGEGLDPFGCETYPAGTFDGQWVWLEWEVSGSPLPCPSGARFNNVEQAGGAGVVLNSPRDIFDAGIAGNATIPGVQFNREFSERLDPAAEAGELDIRLDADLQATATGLSNALDTLAAFSSRGVHGSNGVVKPDVAAPGVSIGSVQVGTGDGASVKSGTSMAAPHTAGIAALVVAATDFNPYEVKNMIMNTATTDLLTADGIEYAPNRVGSGRVDAVDALDTPVIAYAADDQALGSVNFGVMELGSEPVTEVRQITVENKSDVVKRYTASYLQASTMPGVEITVVPQVPVEGDPDAFDVFGNGTATLDVTLQIDDPAELAKTIDPAAEVIQLGAPRQFLADVSGRIQLEGENTLRVPVYSAPKPTSEMSAGPRIDFADAQTMDTLVTLEGRGLSQGEGAANYTSLVSPLVLGTESPRADERPLESLYSLDLRTVGAASTVPAVIAAGDDPSSAETPGLLNIGISTWQNWPQLAGNNSVEVEFDTDGDGAADFVGFTGRADGLDLIIFDVYALDAEGQLVEDEDGVPVLLAQTYGNGVFGDVDTNTFDTNVITFPFPAAALGLDLTASAPISYRVSTFSAFNVDPDGESLGPVDQTDWIGFNVTEPALWFTGETPATSFLDVDGATIEVNRERGITEANAVFLHHHNATDTKDEIVPIQVDLLRFPDVPGNLHEDAINWLADEGLTTGYPDGTYRPLASINRDAMAAFLYRLAGEPAFSAPTVSPFTDVPTTDLFYKEITWMESVGLTEGYEEDDGTFTYRRLSPVNRDAMAAFMNRFSGLYCNIADAEEYVAPQEPPFPDVPVDDLFHREISWMAENEITTGWPDGEYKRLQPVARDAMAAFIERLDTYVEENGGCNP
ncbi:S8 family serine peptidase [uncultured Arthrobacter sp.]|uniref:S8 family serine peptidase n=1 Tax=uncultured Arthrobacter sp. TaxID=114050 RepID=UPI0026029AD0|nr:S8 family serine peptidase [uncultured Arthrobacter sp.]